MILQSVRWRIFCVGIPHTTWRVHVFGSCSHQLFEWLWDRVTSFYRCLLQRLSFSESRHFSWDIDPANTMDRRLTAGSRPVCVLVFLVVSWWNRRSLYLCSSPHQSNKEHSFLLVVFLVSCVQLSLCNLLQHSVIPVVVVRTWYHLDLWFNAGTGHSCQILPPCLEICVLLLPMQALMSRMLLNSKILCNVESSLE